MVTRILPEHEWPRLRDTECKVDQSRGPRMTRGAIVSVERGREIIATAFVFKEDDDRTHADGVWVKEKWRTVAVKRQLLRGMKWVADQLGGSPIVIKNAPWLAQRESRANGLQVNKWPKAD